jgi:hypothetical protein
MVQPWLETRIRILRHDIRRDSYRPLDPGRLLRNRRKMDILPVEGREAFKQELAIQNNQCKNCHFTLTELLQTINLTDPNDIAFQQALLNPVVKLEPGDTVLVSRKGEPLWKTLLLPGGTYELVGKATGQVYSF